MTADTHTQAVEPSIEEMGGQHLGRRVLQLAVLALVVAAIITTLPGLDQVRERFAHAQASWLIVVALLELASCLSYVVAFRGVFCRRLGWRFSYEIGMSEQATNVLLPVGGVGGLALGAWALRQGGMSTGHIARRSVAFFVLTSAPNFILAAVLGLAIATGVLPGSGPLALTLTLAVLAIGAIVLVLLLPWILNRIAPARPPDPGTGSRMARVRRAVRHGATAAGEGVQDAVALVKERQPMVVIGAVGYMAFDMAALAAAFAAFGSTPPFATFAFAYVVGPLGGLIPVPGGIGGTEGGLIGALALYGTPLADATAAVLAYRAFQLGIPAILGTIAFIQLRRTLATSDAPAALCEPLAQPLPTFTVPAFDARRS